MDRIGRQMRIAGFPTDGNFVSPIAGIRGCRQFPLLGLSSQYETSWATLPGRAAPLPQQKSWTDSCRHEVMLDNCRYFSRPCGGETYVDHAARLSSMSACPSGGGVGLPDRRGWLRWRIFHVRHGRRL